LSTILTRTPSRGWKPSGWRAFPKSVVLYCARHRFSTDAMEGTGNGMAVMDAMGHGSVNTTRIYTHSNVQQIREAIERRNRLSTMPVEAVQKPATKAATVATVSENVVSD
jgi:site-specific recombinase XerC